MTRKQRLMATLNGRSVDRPPVSFYEINGETEHPENKDPFNIYSHPSWKPLIDLSTEKTDRIVRMGIEFKGQGSSEFHVGEKVNEKIENGSLVKDITINTAGDKTFTARTRQDPDVNTVWTLEHFLKSTEDLKAYLEIPLPEPHTTPETTEFMETENRLGDTGIMIIDFADPICIAADLFSMEDYLCIALTEKALFRKLLDRCAEVIYPRVEAIAKALPGRLWRIVGPEYASAPYLPADYFKEYVTEYDTQIVSLIHKHGGYARIHSHGRLMGVLDHIAATGCMGLDPIEPPPQGDVELSYVREKYGEQMVLFGNLEASDLVNLEPSEFEKKIMTAIEEGAKGKGRGFVLLPSACPYDRVLPDRALANYRKMVEVIERL